MQTYFSVKHIKTDADDYMNLPDALDQQTVVSVFFNSNFHKLGCEGITLRSKPNATQFTQMHYITLDWNY